MDREEHERLSSAIDLAISHTIEHGSDDIFKPPVFSGSIERELISTNSQDFRRKIEPATLSFINQGNLTRNPIGRVRTTLTVRDAHSFRQVAWLEPEDSIKYLSLALLLFGQIESARIPKAAKIVHSHRLSDIPGNVFDGDYGYSSFRSRTGELAADNAGCWMIVTDISNFYDRIGNHSLENHLLDAGCERKYVNLLREILYFWSGDRRSFGIPVGTDASRIVSEAVLIDIDRRLMEREINFVRYVDDFRILAKTKAQAYQLIQFVTELLAEEGLSLNVGKTRITQIVPREDIDDGANEFKPEEHQAIDLTRKELVEVRRRVSGRTTYSKYYREPGQEALRKLRQLQKSEILASFNSSIGADQESQLKLLVKYFVYVDQDCEILRAVVDAKITSVFYVVDALLKEKDKFEAEKKTEIINCIFSLIDWERMAYPYQIPVLRLFSSDGYRHDELAQKLVDNHRLLDNLVFLREVVLVASASLDRPRLRRLALDVFPAVPAFVQRAIFKAVVDHKSLSLDEKRPLLKNMRQTAADWYIGKIPDPCNRQEEDAPDAPSA